MKLNKDDEYVKTTKGYGNSTSLQRQMLPQIKTLCINNSWLVDTNLTSLNKILFIMKGIRIEMSNFSMLNNICSTM